MFSQADPRGGFRAVRGRSGSVRSTSGSTGHEISFRRTGRWSAISVDGFQLRPVRTSGRDARALAGVAGATPRPWPLACHGGGSAWTRHAILRGRLLRSSDPCGKAKRRAGPVRPGFSQRYRTVHRPAGRPTGPPPPRSGAHIAFPRRDRLVWERPEGAGAGCANAHGPEPAAVTRTAGSLPAPSERALRPRPSGTTRRKTFARYGYRRPAGAHVRSAGVRIGTLCRFRGPVRLYVVLRAVHRGWRMNQLCAAFMISAT